MLIIAIGGEPATGKSTIVKAIISQLGDSGKVEDACFFGLKGTLVNSTFILGSYSDNDTFGGTDRYQMSIQPIAELFLEMVASEERKGANSLPFNVILFEGDRLFNLKFLQKIVEERIGLVTYIVTALAEVKKNRHKERGDTQNSKWLKGRKTKIRTIENVNRLYKNCFNLIVIPNNTAEDFSNAVETILKTILEVTNET